MKVCRPDYYKEFQCIGSACTDTCCAQWEIEVDETSADRYAGDTGPLAEDFRKYLVRKEDENYFRLTAEKRCPFLNEANLCRMILTMGEDALCDICREHPRFYHWFGSYTEVGLGLCCEEAGRLLFSRKDPIRLELLSDESEEIEEAETWEEDIWVELLLKARKRVIQMLQDRQLSLEMRVGNLLSFAELAQPYLDTEDEEGLERLLETWPDHMRNNSVKACKPVEQEAALHEMLTFYGKLESLDQSWPSMMETLKKQLPELIRAFPVFMNEIKGTDRETDYEQLLVYFVFRYFMEAIYDSNLLSPLRFAVVSLQMILLLDLECRNRTGNFTMEDRIRIAKWYSKEIEYCPDNMELLAERLEVQGIWQ
ncbi:MAG: flagellin lysine-N-methylase [Lachnospiraceae bacterium]|nr:flagellin lysine-N-methylase [Lachnospiraceae bacterium]